MGNKRTFSDPLSTTIPNPHAGRDWHLRDWYSAGAACHHAATHTRSPPPPRQNTPNIPVYAAVSLTKLLHYLLDLSSPLLKPRPLLQVCKRGLGVAISSSSADWKAKAWVRDYWRVTQHPKKLSHPIEQTFSNTGEQMSAAFVSSPFRVK